jgi:periplasmic copper chaperone A
MKHPHPFALALLLAAAATPALAQKFSAGDIVVEEPWARATPKGASVGAGYMTIRNNGAAPDKLTGGSTDFASQVQVHEMAMKDGVMTMRQLPDGLTIPPNGAVTLGPKGYHLMFQGLKQPLTKGETVKATLTFEHAGAIPIDLRVDSIGAMGPGGKAAPDQMKGMKMD